VKEDLQMDSCEVSDFPQAHSRFSNVQRSFAREQSQMVNDEDELLFKEPFRKQLPPEWFC
jgi:hypothetical protein